MEIDTTIGENGVVYWITGLAGSGKTTIGKKLFWHLKQTGREVVYLDGDTLRQVFAIPNAYGSDDRRKLAFSYSRLCRMLSDQGIDVVCATISMFKDVRAFNRETIKRYLEIYLYVPLDVLRERDQKQLYSGAENGSIDNVVGLDIQPELPTRPDITLPNGSASDAATIMNILLEKLAKVEI